MKTWVRIALFIGLTLVLWYLVANLTRSMTGNEEVPAPATSSEVE